MACAQRALAEGAKVLVLDRAKAKFPIANVDYLVIDLQDEDLEEKLTTRLSIFGSPDVLINSAAIQTYGSVDATSDEGWERTSNTSPQGHRGNKIGEWLE